MFLFQLEDKHQSQQVKHAVESMEELHLPFVLTSDAIWGDGEKTTTLILSFLIEGKDFYIYIQKAKQNFEV